jgi:hypothetical protein
LWASESPLGGPERVLYFEYPPHNEHWLCGLRKLNVS